MSWTAAIVPILAAVGLLMLPGLALSWCLGLRNFSGVALAPVFSTAIVGAAGIASGWSGVPWSIGLYLAASAVACAAALVFARIFSSREQRATPKRLSAWRWVPTIVAVAAAAIIISWRLMQLFQGPENISQRFDNVFHLNAVRFILDTGNASTLSLASMNGNSGIDALYPAAWHSFVALVNQVTGASVPVSVNSFNIAFSALAWPLGCIMLIRQVIGSSMAATVAGAVVSAGQIAFPYMLLVWGPLYPNALSLSLLPATIAVVVTLAGLSRADQSPAPRLWASLILAVPALATAHMSSLNALLVLTLPLIIFVLIRRVRGLVAERARLVSYFKLALVSAAAIGLFAGLWMKVRPGFYDFWGPHQSKSGAIGEAITNAPLGTPASWTISILAVIGFIVVWKQPEWRWVPFSYGVSVILYVTDAAAPRGPLRDFLTGVWYQDTYRLAAFLPVFTTLLCAIGAVALAEQLRTVRWKKLQSIVSRLQPRQLRATATTSTIAAVVILSAATQYGAIREYISDSKAFFSFDANSPILSPDEAQLLYRLPSLVPEDAVIADNPWNGSSLAYALADRKVLVYHLFSDLSPDKVLVNNGLSSAASDSDICPAVRANNVEFLLDFGDHYLAANPSSNNFPGVTNVQPSNHLALVDSQGAARLYRVIGCS